MDDEGDREATRYGDGDPSAVSIAEAVGRRVRELRQEYDVRQERVAEAARDAGLTWARTSVATLEAGRRDLGIDELALLPLIMTEACGAPITLRSLVPAECVLRLGHYYLTGERLLDVLRGGVSDNYYGVPQPNAFELGIPTDPEEAREALDLYERWPGMPWELFTKLRRQAGQEADLKAAKKLGVPVPFVVLAAHALWNRSLTAERDERAATAGLPETTRGRQTALGNTTRRLLVELADELSAAESRARTREESDNGSR